MIKQGIPYHMLELHQDLKHWEEMGRVMAIQLGGDSPLSVKLLNVHLPNVLRQREEMTQAVYAQLAAWAGSHIVMMGDLNESAVYGPLTQTLLDVGYYVPMCAGQHQQDTFVQGPVSSCIDTIIVGPSLRHVADDFYVTVQGELQHRAVHLHLRGLRHKSRGHVWEAPQAVKDPVVNHGVARNTWDEHSDQLDELIVKGDLDAAWQLWSACYEYILVESHHQKIPCIRRGDCPKFRLHDIDKEVRQRQQRHDHLHSAESAEDRARIMSELDASMKRSAQIAIKAWRTALDVSIRQHSRYFWRWISGPRRIPAHQMRTDSRRAIGPQECLHLLTEEWGKVFHKTEHMSAPPVFQPPMKMHDIEIPFEKFAEDLYGHIRRTPGHKAHGLDGWRAAEWRAMDKESAKQFAKICYLALQQARTPRPWQVVKVSFLPKTSVAAPHPLDHRPLAIMNLAYRTLAKWIAEDMQSTMMTMDSRSVGGLPRRSAVDAWFDIMATLEQRRLEPHELDIGSHLEAIQIDTEKFFDAVPHDLAVNLMLAKGLRPASVLLWQHQIAHHVKYLFLGPYCNPHGFQVSRGVPQGDAISMYGALVTMEHWMNSLSPAPICMKCYVDDRLLYGEDHPALQNAIRETEQWDTAHGFKARKKTVAWSTDGDVDFAWQDGSPINQDASQAYVGLPFIIKHVPAEKWYKPKLDRIYATIVRVTNAAVPVAKRVQVIEAKCNPVIAYVAPILRPTEKQFKQLRSWYRRAAWPYSNFAAEAAVSALLHKSHRYDPELHCIMNTAVQLRLLLGRDEAQRNRWSQLWRARTRSEVNLSQGLASLIQSDFQRMGITLSEDGLQAYKGERLLGSIHGMEKQLWLHEIREGCRVIALARLHRQSRTWEGAAEIDIGGTMCSWRKLRSEHFGEPQKEITRNNLQNQDFAAGMQRKPPGNLFSK